MIFNQLDFVTFVVCFSTQQELSWTAENNDDNDYSILENLHSLERDRNSFNPSYISSEASGKRSNISTSSSSLKKLKSSALKYNCNTEPIDPRINETAADSLRRWEEIFYEKGEYPIWKNLTSLTNNQAKELCMKTWKMQVQEIPEIEVKHGMFTDCDIAKIFGPLAPGHTKYYTGIFRYLKKSPEFFPDLVRCNCAVLKKVKGIIRTENNSKRYFFLFKHTDTMYYVLTIHGELRSRTLKIVNIREIYTENKSTEK